VSSDNFVVVDKTDTTRVIGETDFNTALEIVHEKAIYIVEGRLYQVEELDFEGRKAYVRHIDCDYYTDAITNSRVTPLDTAAAAGERPGALPAHGDVHVVSRVVGFKKIKFYTNENVGSGELDLPERQMHTTSYWLTIPRELMTALPYSSDDRRDGVVGLSHAMRQIAQLLLMCDAATSASRSAPHGRPRRMTRRPPPRVPPLRGARRCRTATSPGCSSTTTTPAASASASRCSGCTATWSRARASSSPGAPASPAARHVWDRWRRGARAKVALEILGDWVRRTRIVAEPSASRPASENCYAAPLRLQARGTLQLR
jgi:hypothetical protein